MSDDKEKKVEAETLTPFACDGTSGFAVHKDGDDLSVVPFIVPPEGRPLNGHPIFANRGDGSFERVDLGPRSGTKGPAQVATEAYRTSWERTFGSRGGVS